MSTPARTPVLDEWGPTRLRYVPTDIAKKRSDKQEAFLRSPVLELLYGGAAGGGKSLALLMAALQYADVPGYNALLLRKTYADLSKPGALMDVGRDWLTPTNAHWKNDAHTWTFPSGATLSFGYLQTEQDKFNYHSAEYHFIGFDEVTGFTLTQYLYLFSRLRRGPDKGAAPDGTVLSDIPLRIRAASNPGGPGHFWVAERFVDKQTASAPFLPATLDDNPNVDREAYERSLAKLPLVERLRLRYGDWEAVPEGDLFTASGVRLVDDWDRTVAAVRYWDLASTPESDDNPDPDWTVGAKWELGRDGYLTVTDVIRFRAGPGDVKKRVKQTAVEDGYHVHVFVEQDPGQAGKAQVHEYAREMPGVIVRAGMTRGKSKRERAVPVAAAFDNQVARLNRNIPILPTILSEMRLFGQGGHDDIVDTLSGGYWAITSGDIQGVTSAHTVAATPALAARSVGGSVAGMMRDRQGR